MSENKAIQKESRQTPEHEPVYVPRVDIRETPDHFEVVVDMPGVDEKSVEATVHNRVLTIEGWSCPDRPDEYEALGQEFGCGRYRRDFTLPDSIASEHIQARVKHGVLAVTIPKKEEVKARKILVTG
ncbi:MAG: Hsp20/alpha crystallin family protein [Kiritimatiellae bacterium]|jgi:HSP20 family protein|nr:Hsp20/alpha crystallin family protein [Kiritimatiellia bacterium]MDD4341950.1 Hsp20/alpha crystallin family protein [Kiritimatiellia bacterium]MDY0149669.1 Hsp20/alpha crystallin family protein [Kiritimatiellia bacterium]